MGDVIMVTKDDHCLSQHIFTSLKIRLGRQQLL